MASGGFLRFVEGKLQVPCPGCGKTNAVPLRRVLQGPVCGECRRDLPPPGFPVGLDSRSFDAFIASASLPVLVDFGASWCGPCRMLEPVLERFAQKMAGQVLVAKVDTQASPDLTTRFGVQSIPTLLVFREGREHRRQSGALGEQALASLLA